MAEVYTTKKPRDTVVVDRDHHDNRGLSTGAIVALVILGLIILFFVFGNPFGGGGGGGGGDTNINVPNPTPAGGQ